MTRTEEYEFLTNLSSAMRHSGDVRALDLLWADYAEQIAACSQEGQAELRRLRADRSETLMNERTK
jgi:hypothetical protein